MKVINDLFDYENMKIVQNSEYFKFSVDSILLAEFVKMTNKNSKILDICCGNGAVSLILSQKYSNPIVGYEIQKEMYDLAIDSININSKSNQITIINDDILNIGEKYSKKNFDVIVCNPPYYKNNIHNENHIKSIARHEIKITLEQIFSVVSDYITDKGEFYLIHISSRLQEICNYAKKYNLNIKKMCFIYSRENRESNFMLIKMVKNSKISLKVLAPLYINKNESFKNIFEEDK